MVKQAKTVVALADHTKMDKTGFFKVCDLKEIDFLVTDQPPGKQLQQALINNQVECLILDQ